MEQDNTTEQRDLIPAEEPSADLAISKPITRIGVETELSRYPIHHLAQRKEIAIDIQKIGPNGTVELRWEVNYNAKFGPPGRLAYKLDTLVINKQIDSEARPLPRIIKLGSMREIAAMLDLGNDTPALRRALRQNVGAIISAKLKYKTAGGEEKTLEADFSRYTAVFTGERLPDGQKADAVFLILNDVYREVLNNAPVRPLNYDYLKSLPPAPQRFYEIISARIYAALKHGNPYARILYSEFCTYSALTRYFEYESFRVQMKAIHQPHLKSKYIEKVHYEEQRDEQGSVVDWMMCYKPGTRARVEHMAFARKTKRANEAAALAASQKEIEITDYEVGESLPLQKNLFESRKRVESKPREPEHPLQAELVKRGISESRAKKILSSLREGQEVLDQLEYVDHLIASGGQKIQSPAGFYIYFLTDNVLVPPKFETSRKKKVREELQAKAHEDALRQMELETEYEQYKAAEIERYVQENITQDEINEITKKKRASIEVSFKNFSLMPQTTQHAMLWGAVKAEFRARVPLQSFEDFRQARTAQLSLFTGTEGLPSPESKIEPKSGEPAKPSKTPPGATKPPRTTQRSQPKISKPLEAKFDATVGVPEQPVSAVGPKVVSVNRNTPVQDRPAEPTKTADASPAIESQMPDDRLLMERYEAFRLKEATRALDSLGLLEKGRRLRELRGKMLSDHPRADEFRQMMADGEYEQFHEISERHLMEVTLAGLPLPAFEDWKRYALSAMGFKE